MPEHSEPGRDHRGRVWAVRGCLWIALAGVAGWLVRGEVRRPEFPEGVHVYTDIVYRGEGRTARRLDVYVPTRPAPPGGRPAILAIHGGGWRGGSKEEFGRMVARLGPQGYVVVSTNYTLSRPGFPSWPTNRDDLREALRWLRKHARTFDINPEQIAALGASAGGHLAAVLGTSPAADPEARVQAVVDFYGPTDLRALARSRPATGEPIALLIGGRADDLTARYDEASPLLHVSSDDPPMLLVHGTDDPLIPVEQTRALAEALGRAGVPHRLLIVDRARHGFGLRLDDGRDLLPDVLAFLDSVWKASPVRRQPAS